MAKKFAIVYADGSAGPETSPDIVYHPDIPKILEFLKTFCCCYVKSFESKNAAEKAMAKELEDARKRRATHATPIRKPRKCAWKVNNGGSRFEMWSPNHNTYL